MRDITSATNNPKRGRGRPRKTKMEVLRDVNEKEASGEKSGEHGKPISDTQFISNF